MNSLLKIFLAAVLVDNVVFVQYLALCPFMGMTSSTDKSFGMGMATTFVIMLATIVTFPIYHFILVPLKLEFLQTLIFILVIASLVQLVEFYLKKSAPGLYSSWVFTLHLLQLTVLFLLLHLTVLQRITHTLNQSFMHSAHLVVSFSQW